MEDNMGIYFSGEEVIGMGIKIEEQGEQYYRTFANKTNNEKVKEIFEFLATEEVKHKSIFKGFQEKFGNEDFVTPLDQEEVGAYMRAIIDSRIFSDPEGAINVAKNARDELDAIEKAISFEKDTILFFHEVGKFVKENQQTIIQKLIDEERSHIQKLVEIKESLK